MFFIPKHRRVGMLGHLRAPTRSAPTDVTDAHHNVHLGVWHPLSAEEFQLGKQDLRADRDGAGNVISVLEVLGPLSNMRWGVRRDVSRAGLHEQPYLIPPGLANR